MKGWSGRCVSRVEGVCMCACVCKVDWGSEWLCVWRGWSASGWAVYLEGVLLLMCMLCIYRFVVRLCVCVHRCLVHMKMSLLNAAARQTHLFFHQPVVICFLLLSLSPPHLSLFCLIPLASSVEKQLCALIIGVYNFTDIPHFGVWAGMP